MGLKLNFIFNDAGKRLLKKGTQKKPIRSWKLPKLVDRSIEKKGLAPSATGKKDPIAFLQGIVKPRIGVRIFVLFVPVILVAVILVGVQSYQTARDSIIKQFEASSLQGLQQTNLYFKVMSEKYDAESVKALRSGTLIYRVQSEPSKDASFMQLLNQDSNQWQGAEKGQKKSAIVAAIRDLQAADVALHSVWILREKEISFGTAGFDFKRENNITYSEIPWFNKLQNQDEKERGNKAFWISTHLEEFTTKPQDVISLVRWIRMPNPKNGSLDGGLYIFNLKPQFLDEALDAYEEHAPEGAFMFILDGEGTVLNHPNKEVVKESWKDQEYVQDILNSRTSYGTTTYRENGETYFVTFNTSESTGWKLVAVTPQSVMMKDIEVIKSKIVFMGIFCIFLAAIITVLLSISISRPINRMMQIMKTVEGGDLTTRMKVSRMDEIGLLSLSFNTMLEKVQQLFVQSANSSVSVVNASQKMNKTTQDNLKITKEISRAIESISQGLEQQSGSLTNSVGMISQLSDKMGIVINYSGLVAGSSRQASQVSKQGKQTVSKLQEKSIQTQKIVEEVITSIQELGKYSVTIGNILKTITFIANETNLLSLNASIEAARAGEAGRGFAVVANEVRKLAQQSSNAAGEISSIIGNIQEKIKNAEDITSKVYVITTEQDEYVGNTAGAFDGINYSVDIIMKDINNLDLAIEDMTVYKDKILDFITDISAISEESAAASEEISASTMEQGSAMESLAEYADHLNEIAGQLQQSIRHFKIS